jgi:hypothetical protein
VKSSKKKVQWLKGSQTGGPNSSNRTA